MLMYEMLAPTGNGGVPPKWSASFLVVVWRGHLLVERLKQPQQIRRQRLSRNRVENGVELVFEGGLSVITEQSRSSLEPAEASVTCN